MVGMAQKDTLFERIKALAPEAVKRYGATSIGVFGSALDPAREPGDVDILVEFDAITFDKYMGLKFYFEDALGKKVDLVPKDSIKPALRQRILSQVRYVS
jgi:hypothetical protein